MNRKNLTAAVLAGLAGAAGIAGTAQAVNLNPDGLGQVLIYPYYTSNSGNQTILSVVNTTDNAKAVKVRFLEGYNSREVLDFNLYLSPWDVWTAAITDKEGTPFLIVNDDSCTVPYLYPAGGHEFLSLAYNDNKEFSADGGPTGIDRAAEGHFEMIEMGTILAEDCTGDDDPVLGPVGETFCDVTHRMHYEYDDDDDKVEGSGEWGPGDCAQLTKNWTLTNNFQPLGMWTFDPTEHLTRNSGGLFGGAAVVNSDNGTMYSYDAKAIQGYDTSEAMRHEQPGTTSPSLNEGSETNAYVFFGVPNNKAQELYYLRPVGAISAVFMHEHIMNEYTMNEDIAASTEWVVTFPTKNWYVDEDLIVGNPAYFYAPVPGAPNCNNWLPGDLNPAREYRTGGKCPAPRDPNAGGDHSAGTGGYDCADDVLGWEFCTFPKTTFELVDAVAPFTELFDGEACEFATLEVWDRDERSHTDTPKTGTRPPVVSPSIPGTCDSTIQDCDDPVPFEFCYEVNVMRFNTLDDVTVPGTWPEGIFGTPNLGTDTDPESLLINIGNPDGFANGWARVDLGADSDHKDYAGLIGLPATGFSAYEFENDFLGGGDVQAYYGGLFGHRGNVRRTCPDAGPNSRCIGSDL